MTFCCLLRSFCSQSQVETDGSWLDWENVQAGIVMKSKSLYRGVFAQRPQCFPLRALVVCFRGGLSCMPLLRTHLTLVLLPQVVSYEWSARTGTGIYRD